jgi:hypothetical protein
MHASTQQATWLRASESSQGGVVAVSSIRPRTSNLLLSWRHKAILFTNLLREKNIICLLKKYDL